LTSVEENGNIFNKFLAWQIKVKYDFNSLQFLSNLSFMHKMRSTFEYEPFLLFLLFNQPMPWTFQWSLRNNPAISFAQSQDRQLQVRKLFQSLGGDYGSLAASILLALVCSLLVNPLQTKQVNCSHQNNPIHVYNLSKNCVLFSKRCFTA